MKKLLLLCLGVLTSVSWAQEVGSAGRLLQNEYHPNKQARCHWAWWYLSKYRLGIRL